MNDEINPRAVIGDNNPPVPIFDPIRFAEMQAKVTNFADAGGAWLAIGDLVTEEQSQKVTDFVTGARQVYKLVDEARKEAKAPHDERSKAVQAAFLPLLEIIERTVEKLKAKQTAYLKRKAEQERAEQERAKAEADRLRQEAEKAAAEAAARDDIAGEVQAEALIAEAERAEKAAAKPVKVQSQSATGGGRAMSLRRTARCRLVSIPHAFQSFRGHPEVAALLVRLAHAEVRAQKGEKKAPIGFELYFEESAA